MSHITLLYSQNNSVLNKNTQYPERRKYKEGMKRTKKRLQLGHFYVNVWIDAVRAHNGYP